MKVVMKLLMVLLMVLPGFAEAIKVEMHGANFHIVNNSTHKVEAMDLFVFANGVSVLHQVLANFPTYLLEPGQSIDIEHHINPLGRKLEAIIKGIVFDDGTTEGSDVSYIENFVRLKNQVSDGGPAYLGPLGNSVAEAIHLLPLYKKLHPNINPKFIQRNQDSTQEVTFKSDQSTIRVSFGPKMNLKKVTVGPSPYPYLLNWFVYCWMDYLTYPTKPDGRGNQMCSLGMPSPGVVQGSGFGLCPQPNVVVPNKVTIDMYAVAGATCRNTHPTLAVIVKLLYGPDYYGDPLNSNSNLKWGAVAQSTITLYAGAVQEVTEIDSCGLAQQVHIFNYPGVGTCQ